MAFVRRAVFIAAMLACAGALFAQTAPANAGGVSLEAEIQNIEKAAGRQGITAEERRDSLVRLARLRQLSGDIEGAARNWLEAASAVPGKVDDDALLACAYCLAAMGEWDRANTALEPLLSKSARARFLSISLYAIKTGDVSPLAAMADSGDYSQLKNEIYFMLWKTSRAASSENWRRRLAAEFPQTPEGRLASGAVSAIALKPSPFWLFMNGLDSLPLVESAVPTPSERPASVTIAPVAPSQPPVPQAAAPQTAAPQTAAPQTAAPQTARLQTGLFSRQENAQAQIANLRQAGFSPSMEQRGEMWAVVVPSGADQSRTARELKEAGFDSFPLKHTADNSVSMSAD